MKNDEVRTMLKHQARKFRRGDVVTHADSPGMKGIVTAGGLGLTVAWEHGGRSTGSGLLFMVWRLKPRRTIAVPHGALSHKGWIREQAVTAALRRAGIEVRR